MANKFGKELDKTYLSCDNAEERGFIHRDYIAHCLRWTHIVKYLIEKNRYKNARILDLGCGKEAPLIKTLYSSRLLPYYYLGVDAGKITPVINFDKIDNVAFIPETNILDLDLVTFDVVVMLEALEHMEKPMGIQVLSHIRTFMDKDTVFFMSTPCFNGSKAANHVYEWEYMELLEELKKHFHIADHWGTFASIKDYQHLINKEGLFEIFNRFREYYDVNYLATIFAPLFPAQSRNVLWKLISRMEESL